MITFGKVAAALLGVGFAVFWLDDARQKASRGQLTAYGGPVRAGAGGIKARAPRPRADRRGDRKTRRRENT